MIKFEFRTNLRTLRRRLKRWERKEVPFAAANALNDAAFWLRGNSKGGPLVEQWRKDVTARRQNFPGALLKVEKANKTKLRARVYDKTDSYILRDQIEGGTRRPKKGRNLLVPLRAVRRSSSGTVSKAQKKNLVEKDGVLYKPKGKKKLVPYFHLSRTARIDKAYRVDQPVARAQKVFDRAFRKHLIRAIRTSKNAPGGGRRRGRRGRRG